MQKLTGAENALLGTLAGGIEVCIDQPMLYWKNAVQQNLKFTLNPKVVYRGLGASITNMAVLTGFQFIATGHIKSMITGGIEREMSTGENILSGFTGGALSGLICCPMELVMIQQQRWGGNIIGTPARIMANNGVIGLGRGMVTSVGREAVFTAGMLGLAPSIQNILVKNDVNSYAAGVTGAVCGGVMAATISHPLDTVKTCMQGDIEQKTYSSFTRSLNAIYAERGLQRMYSGWGWRCGRMICAIFWINLIKDKIAPIIFPQKFE